MFSTTFKEMLLMQIPSRSNFVVTSWDQSEYDTPTDGPALGRATVKKDYSGDLDGSGVAELLSCRSSDSEAGYVASERITGTLGNRTGTFVVQHGATQNGDHFHLFGYVVSGSGTGDFVGITGLATFRHDENGAIFSLDYEVPDPVGDELEAEEE